MIQSGKQLDELVAKHVLEWRLEGNQWVSPGSRVASALKPFSADLNAAWELVDKICERGFRLQLDGSRIWQARFYKSAAHSLETRAFAATAATPALAICVASLAVQGVEAPK